MNLLSDIETKGEAWIEVSENYTDHGDAWYRGYAAALNACGHGLLQLVEDERTAEHADAVRRGVTS